MSNILGTLIKSLFDHPLAQQQQQAPDKPSPHQAPAPDDRLVPRHEPASDKPQPQPGQGSVDIGQVLDAMASQRHQHLNWRESVVDLLKVVGLDSSLDARHRLAEELHAPSEIKQSSAMLNEWLHDAVLKAIEANGGKLPPDLARSGK